MALFNILVLTLVFHTYLAYIIRKTNQEKKNVEIGNKCTKVQPIDSLNYSFGKEDDIFEKKKLRAYAQRINTIAKVIFVVFLVLFNIGFWSLAFKEHLKPAEEYII